MFYGQIFEKCKNYASHSKQIAHFNFLAKKDEKRVQEKEDKND